MWIWIFAIVVLFFVLDWFVAKRFDEIAQMKGQPPEAYFWWCFWLGVIGWAMVIALPDRAGTSPKSADSSDELPELYGGNWHEREIYQAFFPHIAFVCGGCSRDDYSRGLAER